MKIRKIVNEKTGEVLLVVDSGNTYCDVYPFEPQLLNDLKRRNVPPRQTIRPEESLEIQSQIATTLAPPSPAPDAEKPTPSLESLINAAKQEQKKAVADTGVTPEVGPGLSGLPPEPELSSSTIRRLMLVLVAAAISAIALVSTLTIYTIID